MKEQQPHRPTTPASERAALPPEQLEAVIERASALQVASPSRDLSEAEVVAIGEEVGLAPEHVRAALRQHRSATVEAETPVELTWRVLLLGSAFVHARREVARDPAALHRDAASWLGHQRMVAVREQETASVWEPDQRWVATLSKALFATAQARELGAVPSLRVEAVAVGEEASLLSVTADLTRERDDGLFMVFLPLLMLLPGVMTLAWLGALSLWAALAIAGGAALLVVLLARRAMAARRARIALLIEGMLDQVEG